MKSGFVDGPAGVQISFNLPADAALLLRQLAYIGSPGLAQIGVTSISIDDDDAVPLKIGNVPKISPAAASTNNTPITFDKRHANSGAQPSQRLLSSLHSNILQLFGVTASGRKNVSGERNSDTKVIDNISELLTCEPMESSDQEIEGCNVGLPISILPKLVPDVGGMEEIELDEKKYNRPWQSTDAKETDKKIVDIKHEDLNATQSPLISSFNQQLSNKSLSSCIPQLTDLSTSPTTGVVSKTSSALVNSNFDDVSSPKHTVRPDEWQPDKKQSIDATLSVRPQTNQPTQINDLDAIRRHSLNETLNVVRQFPHPIRPDGESPVTVSPFPHPIRPDCRSPITVPTDGMNYVLPTIPPSVRPDGRSPVTVPTDWKDSVSPTFQHPIRTDSSSSITVPPTFQHLIRTDSSSSITVPPTFQHPIRTDSSSSITVPPTFQHPIRTDSSSSITVPPTFQHLIRTDSSSSTSVPPTFQYPIRTDSSSSIAVPPTFQYPIRTDSSSSITMPIDAMLKFPLVSRHQMRPDVWSPMTMDDSHKVHQHPISRPFEEIWKNPSVSQQPSRPGGVSPMKMSVDDLRIVRSISPQPSRSAVWSPFATPMDGTRKFPPMSHQPISPEDWNPVKHSTPSELLDIQRSSLSVRVPKKKRRKRDTREGVERDTFLQDARLPESARHDPFNPSTGRYSPDKVLYPKLNQMLFPDQFLLRESSSFPLSSQPIEENFTRIDNQKMLEKFSPVTESIKPSIDAFSNRKINLQNLSHGTLYTPGYNSDDEHIQFKQNPGFPKFIPGMIDEPRNDYMDVGKKAKMSSGIAFTSPGSPPRSPSLHSSKTTNLLGKRKSPSLSATYPPLAHQTKSILETDRYNILRNLESLGQQKKSNRALRDGFDVGLPTIKPHPVVPARFSPLGGIFNGMFDDLRRREEHHSISSMVSGSSVGFHSPLDARMFQPHEDYDAMRRSVQPSGSSYDLQKSVQQPPGSSYDLQRSVGPFDLRRPFYPETYDVMRPLDPVSQELKKPVDSIPYYLKKSFEPVPYEFSLGNWVSSHSPAIGRGSPAQPGGQIYQPWQESSSSDSSRIQVKLKHIDPELRRASNEVPERFIDTSSVEDRFIDTDVSERPLSPDYVKPVVVPKKRPRLNVAPALAQGSGGESFVSRRFMDDHSKHDFTENARNTGDGFNLAESAFINSASSLDANSRQVKDLPFPSSSIDSSKINLKKIRLVRWSNSSAEKDDGSGDRLVPLVDNSTSVRPVLWKRSNDTKRDKISSETYRYPDDNIRIIPSVYSPGVPDIQRNTSNPEVEYNSPNRLESDSRSVRRDTDELEREDSRHGDHLTTFKKSSARIDDTPFQVSSLLPPSSQDVVRLRGKDNNVVGDECGGGFMNKKHRAARYFLANRSLSVEETAEVGGNIVSGGRDSADGVESGHSSSILNVSSSTLNVSRSGSYIQGMY